MFKINISKKPVLTIEDILRQKGYADGVKVRCSYRGEVTLRWNQVEPGENIVDAGDIWFDAVEIVNNQFKSLHNSAYICSRKYENNQREGCYIFRYNEWSPIIND